jgi:hypothetical protein
MVFFVCIHRQQYLGSRSSLKQQPRTVHALSLLAPVRGDARSDQALRHASVRDWTVDALQSIAPVNITEKSSYDGASMIPTRSQNAAMIIDSVHRKKRTPTPTSHGPPACIWEEICMRMGPDFFELRLGSEMSPSNALGRSRTVPFDKLWTTREI